MAPEELGQRENHTRTREFVRLLTQHERRVHAYIFSVVPNASDASDLVQETNVRLWEQFDQYEPASDFGAWACTIARYLVMAYRSEHQRDRLQFSQDFVDLVADEVARAADEADARHQALAGCLRKLSQSSREALRHCYAEGEPIQKIADTLGRTPAATYKMLSRIRQTLRACIERTLSQEGTA